MAVNSVNWMDIKSAYIFSDYEYSVRELAEKFNVPKSTIHEKMIQEDWKTDRECHQNKVLQVLGDYVLIDKARIQERSLKMISGIIESAGARLLTKLMKGEKSLSVSQLASLMQLEEKLMKNYFNPGKKAKKINKKLEDCTTDELEKIANGELLPLDLVEDADVEED